MLLKKIICLLFGYFDGQLKKFVLTDGGKLSLIDVQETDRTPIITIVSRKFYRETTRTYPVENAKEVKKLISLELLGQNSSHFNIGYCDNGQSSTNIWHFQERVPKALFRLPESLLLSLSAKEEQIIHNQKEPASFIIRAHNLVHSLPQSNMVANSQRFAMSVGVNVQHDNKIIDETNFVNQLIIAIKALPLQTLMRFIDVPKSQVQRFFLMQVITPVTVLFTSYLLLTSTFIAFKEHNLQEQISAKNANVSDVLALQASLEDKQQRYLALKDFLAEQQTSADLWLILFKLFPDATIQNIRRVDGRYIIRGKAVSATQFLESVIAHNNVVDAKFDFPISANRGLETFIISFKIQHKEKSIAFSEPVTKEKTDERA